MSSDPNNYHRSAQPPTVPRHLTSSDLKDIYQTLQKVLQDHGLTPHPPAHLEGQRKLGLQTLMQQARHAARTLSGPIMDNEHQLQRISIAINLLQTVEQVEKEWRL